MSDADYVLDFKPIEPLSQVARPVSDLLDQLEGQVRGGLTPLKQALSAALLMGAELSQPLEKKTVHGLTTDGLGPSHPLGLLIEQIEQKVRNGLVSLRNGLASACLMGLETAPAKVADLEGTEYQPMVVTP